MSVKLTMEQEAWLEEILNRAHVSDPHSDAARSMRRRLLLNLVEDMMQGAYVAGKEAQDTTALDEARAGGYKDGHADGHLAGHGEGHEEGFAAGRLEGFDAGVEYVTLGDEA